MDLVFLGEDGGDVAFVGDDCLLGVDLFVDLCLLGMAKEDLGGLEDGVSLLG